MRTVLCAAFLAAFAHAASNDSPSGTRITPPTISVVSPQGVARGATVEMTIEGFNLAKASAIYFSEKGITARIERIKELPDLPDIRLGSNGTLSTIDLGPLPPRNQITLELDIDADAPIGPVDFRVQTPLGTSPSGRFLIEPYYGESSDREPNDTAEGAVETFLPAILVGAISKPGDVDYYKIKVNAGERLVFENGSKVLGSRLRPVVSIFDADQTLIKEFLEDGGRESTVLAHQFEKAGTYYIRVSDYEAGGSMGHSYRIKVGKLPYALSAFPLGVQQGKTATVQLHGYNLGKTDFEVKGEPASEDPYAVIFRPKVGSGFAFEKVKLALGKEPEILAAGKGIQPITLPVTVNGKLISPEKIFRFHARNDQKLILEVNAARLGSPLDSMLEVVDANGKPIERATIRCTLETSTTLRDHDSASRGIRINSTTGFAPGDLMMVGGEIVQVEAMPRGPDDDFVFTSFGGQRLALLDTTPEAHALDSPVYKVQISPPGTHFASNGLPVVHLPYRNDDGGPGYGKDSKLHFTAPADGDYLVRLRDVRGLKGEEYAYRLTVREPAPDYRLAVNPRNPNVPRGGRIPLTVTALRLDDFDGPIHVAVKDLPEGLHATEATILPGEITATILLSADENANLEHAAPLIVSDGNGHVANPDDKLKLISLMPKADVQMWAETKEITLQPGGKAQVQVAIKRNNGFGGRVPVEVRDLPHGVLVTDVGLNGVLLNEDEEKRSFTLQALPSARPGVEPIIVSGQVETRAGQQNSFAAEPITLKITR